MTTPADPRSAALPGAPVTDAPEDLVTGVVLAGGASHRYGSDKLATRIGGRRLLDLAVAGVGGVASTVIVALASGDDRTIAVPHGVSLVRVHDDRPLGGPLVGLGSALREIRRGRVVVVAGDMPSLAPAVLRALLERLATSGADACLPVVAGAARPLPSAIRAEVAAPATVAALASDDHSLRGMLARLRVVELPEAAWRALDPDGVTFRDIDAPDS